MLAILLDSTAWILISIIGILMLCLVVLIAIFIGRKAKEKRKLKTYDYFSKIIHDLKTPIYAIDGFTLLAKNSLDQPEKVEEYLNKISNISVHMLSLVKDVLDLSKLNNNKLEIINTIENLDDIIDSCLIHVEPQMTSRNIQFEKDVQFTHNKVIVDKLHLIQILTNLLSNAIKYTESKGHILFKVLEQPKSNDTSTYIFMIKDTGYGMSEDFQKRLFEPFAQERALAHTDTESSGLGLFIVKKLVELMDGKIEVESKVDEGSCFNIFFDLDFIS